MVHGHLVAQGGSHAFTATSNACTASYHSFSSFHQTLPTLPMRAHANEGHSRCPLGESIHQRDAVLVWSSGGARPPGRAGLAPWWSRERWRRTAATGRVNAGAVPQLLVTRTLAPYRGTAAISRAGGSLGGAGAPSLTRARPAGGAGCIQVVATLLAMVRREQSGACQRIKWGLQGSDPGRRRPTVGCRGGGGAGPGLRACSGATRAAPCCGMETYRMRARLGREGTVYGVAWGC